MGVFYTADTFEVPRPILHRLGLVRERSWGERPIDPTLSRNTSAHLKPWLPRGTTPEGGDRPINHEINPNMQALEM
jgi:hypothetical protein